MAEENKMIIESLKMKDFRQFKGETKVDFSCDPKKNVTVILGDNTFGKTTLLQAFNWCFYGEVNLPHKEKLLNYEVEKTMPDDTDREVFVEIGIVHKGTHYGIKRGRLFHKENGNAEPTKWIVDMWYRDDDGQTNPISKDQIPEKINSILPKDLSSYFFFDTERVQEVGESADLSSAVKGLLGLTILTNAKRHLGEKNKSSSVIGQLYGELAKCSKNPKVDQVLREIHTATDKRKTLKKEIEDLNQQIGLYEQRVRELDQILVQAKTTKELQKDRINVQNQIKGNTIILERTKNNIRKKIAQGFRTFYIIPLAERAMTLMKNAKVDDKGIKDLTAVTLKELLKRGRCVCGQKLEKGNDAYNHICDEIRYVPPESIGTMVKNYKDELTHSMQDGSTILHDIEEEFQTVCSLENSIEAAERHEKELSEKIAQQKDMSCQESERRNCYYQIKELRKQVNEANRSDASLEKSIKDDQNFIELNLGDTEKSNQLSQIIAYAEAISTWLQKTYERKEVEIREKLEEKVNFIFKEIYTGQRKVQLDAAYHVKLFDNVNGKDIETGESEGLLRVKNFAFIAGLVALAKEKIIADETDSNKENVNLASEPYPLVMDAPFSNADEFHTANISRVLPEVAEQVIMFVMRKDWNYAKSVMNNKVGAMYQLNKIDEVHTKLEAANHV